MKEKKSPTYPFIVECFEQPKCRGKKVTILQTSENLQEILERAGFEDGIASVRIVKMSLVVHEKAGKLRFMKTQILKVLPCHVRWDMK